MKEKLLIRAAIQFRKWMIEESKRPPDLEPLRSHVGIIREKSTEIQQWVRRFEHGTTQKVQTTPYDPHSKSLGIVTPCVYEDIATHMVPDICGDIKNSLDYISNMMRAIVEPGKNIVTPLSMKEAYEELLIIQKAWPSTEYKDGRLSIVLEDIVLEDENQSVSLGDFTIHLRLSNPCEDLSVSSKDDIRSEGGYCHPHITGFKLCTGDGGLAMKDALFQGRLEDYFRIVEAILRTYNHESPYESLIEWYDPQHEDQFYCESCEEWRLDESSCYCECCDTNYCDTCDMGGGCCYSCDNWQCGECGSTCVGCQEIYCSNCKHTCEKCNVDVCESCLSTCMVCENYCCGDCCSESCANCGDKMCESCTSTCGCCQENHCHNCVNDECGNCKNDICSGCQRTCSECNEIICETCDNNCKDCGNPMCETCVEEHTCLLSEVSNAK